MAIMKMIRRRRIGGPVRPTRKVTARVRPQREEDRRTRAARFEALGMTDDEP